MSTCVVAWCVVCGLWCVIFGWWSVVVGLWSVVCGLCCVVGGLWSVVGGQWSVVGGVLVVVHALWSLVGGLWFVIFVWWSMVLVGHCAACCVVLLHSMCVREHVCAATARVLGGAANISLCRSSGVLARNSSDVPAKQRSTHCFARTSLERLARTPLERHNEMFVGPPRPLQWQHIYAPRYTHDAATPHSM